MGKFLDVKNKKIRPLLAGDSGFAFTTTVLTMIGVSFIYSLIIIIVANSMGMTVKQFEQYSSESFALSALSFGLSSIALLASILIFSLYKKQRPFSPLPYKKTHPKYWIVALLLTFGLLFGLNELNNLFISFLEKFGYQSPGMTLPGNEWYHLLAWTVIACILPAFFEESVFRGYFLEGLKGFSTPFIVLIGGLAFSLFHQNPQQTPYQFVCGAVYFLLALKSSSLLPCIAMHFANNFIIILLNFFSVSISKTGNVILTILGLACLVLGLVYLIFIDKKPTTTTNDYIENPANHTKTRFFVLASIGFVACAIMWISSFISNLGA